ncbi:hypothetical protein N7456_012016 [Penicillium angulare]|uniref:Uncharacterized protein n=1 Tax=Penicillium angulare TaxID=116970 RepID=A0A9W9EV32_9EURO|nr:hypothetical protein N7456_012016 [Penicillium angulare]
MSHHTEYSQVSFGTERSNDEFGSLNITLPEGVIRDAAVIESRYILVRITENDVDEFLSSFRSSYDAQGWVSSALKCLEGSWRVSSDALLSMESLWTNTHRLQSEDYEYQEVFYMNMTISIFMADDWKPVRQLACLAVSKDALDALATKSGCMATFGYDANPEVEASSIEGVLERTLNQSIMDNLTAAVSMVCLSSCFYKQGRKMHNHLHVGQSSEMSTGLRFDRSPRMAQLVNYVYANHNFGEGEYFYSYFCSSRSQTKNMIQYRGATIEMWPQLPRLVLESEQQGVLVDGASDNTGLPRRGLFIFSEWLDYQSFSRVVDRVFQEGIYFKTLQLGPTFLSSVGFGYLNRPLRFNHEWRDQACSEVSMQWRQKLEDMMAAQGYHEGAALSCPIMVSSDEETETGE